MDKFSEVEIKVDATGLDPKAFMAFVVGQDDITIDKIRIIPGVDTFYRKGDDVIRARCDGPEQECILTVKKRKSATSLLDRKEVDLVLRPGTDPIMVRAFFELSGWQKEFNIYKSYHFFNVKGLVNGKMYHACVAMYDVHRTSDKKRTFLEVEIERDSDCSAEEAKELLNTWLGRIKKTLLPNATPLNLSLYEYFSKEQ